MSTGRRSVQKSAPLFVGVAAVHNRSFYSRRRRRRRRRRLLSLFRRRRCDDASVSRVSLLGWVVSAAQKERGAIFFLSFFLFRVCCLGFRDVQKRESFEVDLVVVSSVSLVDLQKMCNNKKKALLFLKSATTRTNDAAPMKGSSSSITPTVLLCLGGVAPHRRSVLLQSHCPNRVAGTPGNIPATANRDQTFLRLATLRPCLSAG